MGPRSRAKIPFQLRQSPIRAAASRAHRACVRMRSSSSREISMRSPGFVAAALLRNARSTRDQHEFGHSPADAGNLARAAAERGSSLENEIADARGVSACQSFAAATRELAFKAPFTAAAFGAPGPPTARPTTLFPLRNTYIEPSPEAA